MAIRRNQNSWGNFFKLNKTLNYDWWLLASVFLLTVFGLAFLASSLSTLSADTYRNELLKQLILGVGLGGFLAFILAQSDYHFLLKNAKYFVILNFVLLGFLAIFSIYADIIAIGSSGGGYLVKFNAIQKLSFLPIRPHIANGAIRWIDFPLIPNFQPSEFTKLAVLLYFCSYYLTLADEKITWLKLKKPLYVLAVSALLIMLQPDLGVTLIVAGIVISSLWVAKIPIKILFYIGAIVVILGLILTFTTDYRANRVTAFLDKNSVEAGQIRGVQVAIENGGLFGKGYGNSEIKQVSGTLFEQSTDAIIAIIAEEIGFIGTVLFLSLYLVILWRGLKIAAQAPDLAGQALATGLTVWLVGQAFINLTGMLGLAPLTGVPLPFVSRGGSSMLINLLAVGILLNISSQKVVFSKFNKLRKT